MAVKRNSEAKPNAVEAVLPPSVDNKARSLKTRSTTPRARKTATDDAPQSSTAVATLATSVAAETATQPQEAIARLAYFYWQQRGCPEGDSMKDWLRAEHEVLASSQAQLV